VPPSAPLISEIHAPLERDLGSFNERYLSILKNPPKFEESYDTKMGRERSELLEKRFEEFGVTGRVANVSPGPVITRYEYEPAPGIKVSKIASLSNDLALSMKSSRIRIVAPIPGRSAIGIEVPNHMRRDVYLKEILNSESFTNSRSKLTVAMGVNIVGEPISSDIQQMPHLLIAGATGSGKSVFINAMIASILLRALPEEVRFIMIDPKRIELPVYNGIPHLIRPVISDAKEALSALKDIIGWMDLRYREFARAGVRDIDGYNVKVEKRKPYILIIVDELADLMLMAPSDIEETLTRLAQMSRAVGIHLILATQRPSVDVITGLIKANFPARVAFQVASKTDSRTILDMNGAEKLLGRGDMLFLPPGKGVPERLHGAYISTDEAKGIANLWEERWLSSLLKDKIERAELISRLIVERDIIDAIVIPDLPGAKERLARFVSMAEEKTGISARTIAEVITSVEYYAPLDEQFSTKEEGMREERKEYEEFDELFEDAKRLVVRHQVASVSLLQRHFKIGYARAGRIIDQLERAGTIGPYVGSKAREVMIPREEDQSLKIKN
jgi:S-DNA-T family DNA segregation ATPase FtsK/SpoIIIE